MLLKRNETIVFLGDSLTEADPGYVSFVRDMLQALAPELQLTCLNRGIGGNKVPQLIERVQRDVLAEKPDWVSISIGINDVWHGPDGVTLPDFEKGLTQLYDIIEQGSNAKILLCTPSVIGEDLTNQENRTLQPYSDASQRIGLARGATLVPIRDAFQEAITRAQAVTAEPVFTTDGVHLTLAGNQLFGTTWLKAVGAFDSVLPR
ncbi:MAG: SGNH/GDSL hydrolase family protein [Armatimonadota bacterium]